MNEGKIPPKEAESKAPIKKHNESDDQIGWAGNAEAPRGRDVTVFTRQGCCLCDEAIAMLRRHGLSPQLIDIDNASEGDENLRQMYDHCVPVVSINGKIRFRGRLNEVLLRRILDRC